MEILEHFNFWEGVLWILIAIWFFVDAFRPMGRKRLFYGLCGVCFLLFGVSDFAELYTGAWWRPWWLLMWKGCCICGFIILYVYYRKIKKKGAFFA